METGKQKIYLSPEVEVIETLVQTVICQSGGINDMNREGGSPWGN